jgi:hypothetical protein
MQFWTVAKVCLLNVSEINIKNHKGASEFSSDIYKYLRKEASYGSIIGPFESNPFDCQFKISPLNSVQLF